MGAPAEAKPLCARALAIREKALGPDHPDVAITLNNCGTHHAAAGEYAEAQRLYARALAIYEAAPGPDLPELASVFEGMANLALLQSHPEAAIALAERAASVLENADGPPDRRADAHFLLAQALWDAGVSRGRDRDRARQVAVMARDAYRSAHRERPLANVEAWLAAHPEPE